MEIERARGREYEPVEMDGCVGVEITRLFVHDGEKDGSKVRRFRLKPQGHTARHQHEWSHQVLVERGILTLEREGETEELRADDAVFIEAGELHQFHNRNHYRIHFFCIIPSHAGSL